MDTEQGIAERYGHMVGTLDERGRRPKRWRGGGAGSVPWRATGLSRTVIALGIKEGRGTVPVAALGRIRRPGGGRKRIAETDPEILVDLERLVEPTTRGDPESPLRWTCKSVRTLAAELRERGHQVSHQWVAEALRGLRDSVQGKRKVREGATIPTATRSSRTSMRRRRRTWRRATP